MILDFLDDGVPPDLQVDLCVIGAGPAGISIAQSFIGTPVRVCLVESGGWTAEQDHQALCEGASIGAPGLDPGTSRVRGFGGSCNLWGGGCIPLRPMDLQPREWVPHSGWPLPYAELEPYYAQALAVCGIPGHGFEAGVSRIRPVHPPITFDEHILVNQVFARSAILFGTHYRDRLARARNITVLLHANLLELEADADGDHIRHARIGSLSGRRGTLHARHYVLACGGIENARQLLLSNSVVAPGLGNARDLVGRYFMDHPSGRIGTISSNAPEHLTRPYDRSRGKGRTPSFPEICLSDQTQQGQRLLSARVHPYPVEAPAPRGIRALRRLRQTLRPPSGERALLEARIAAALGNAPVGSDSGNDTTKPERIGKLTVDLGLGLGDIARAATRKLAAKTTVKIDHVDLIAYFEQAPNPDSRVTLGTELDALGQRRVCVDWRLTPLDRRTQRTAAAIFGEQLARSNHGTFQPAPWLAEGGDAAPPMHGTAHHLGTTRMSADPHNGVVDPRCKVHGVSNLHVVGSSIFPTGGWAFPTFTIVALSLRLSERLQASLQAFV